LHELMPKISITALIVNPNSPESERQPEQAQQAARALGWQLHIIGARSESEIAEAFASAVAARAEAVVVGTDPFFFSRREHIVALADHYAVPTIYFDRSFVAAGGLISYGNSISDAYRRAGLQTGRILKGAKPSDLPVDQATRFEFVVNLKTAKALGLEIPPSLLVRADEVIE
jgi:putative ABC transport system substrate-binding protein